MESDVLQKNRWHHYAFVKDGAATTFYRDGVVILSGSLANSFTPTIEALGGLSSFAAYGNFDFEYYRSWEAALTPAEIQAERQSATVVRSGAFSNTPLKSHVDLNDLSGGGHHWTAVGTPSTGEDGPIF